ncbi:transmembrane protein 245 [Canna indica]|uniref:Transmembrane protein 245 n=1 Tax=Canna indica TaxID=4628 RepID=A0AAQ3QNM3_9LILI|nr:transmembrane protein 245 [Canna indica]
MELVPCSSNPNPNPNVPWSEMFRSASLRRPHDSQPSSRTPSAPPPRPARGGASPAPAADAARLALYIAMAHAGLAFSLLLLYGLYRLLHGFVRPLQWALLCSIPLRELQRALVNFWSPPLRLGLAPTLLAVPAALLRASAHTLSDLRTAILHRKLRPTRKVGFSRLIRWLVSFWVFVISYENLGPAAAVALFAIGLLLAGPTATSVVKNASFVGRRSSKSSSNAGGGGFFTSRILKHLNTIIAVSLIVWMIIGVLTGGVFCSYKIGMEGKAAVISLKSHVQKSNYAERIGFKKWMDDNDVPGLVDQYSAKLYDTVWQQIDSLAAEYNLTDFANGFRHFMTSRSGNRSAGASTAMMSSAQHPYSEKLHCLSVLIKNHEWAEIYKELDSFFSELLITREDLVVKAKGLAFQGIEISKRVLSSSTSVLGGSASLMASIALKVASGAVELVNFISQLMVFLWVLYYLITTESGGATEQVVDMLPMSKYARTRTVEVINHAISSVFLATAKIAIFQGCLTWLLLRLYSVHFVYTSTVLAFISSLMPILPLWLSSIPAAMQLFMDGRYLRAALLTAIHLMFMDYGTSLLQKDIPGHNVYLAGLSIIGGMALFPNALEGAIMGPLIMTVFIALKNLYVEFVLFDKEENDRDSVVTDKKNSSS